MHYVAPNGDTNWLDAGPAFFDSLGTSWAMEFMVRRVESANSSILFDAGDAGGANRSYFLIESDRDVIYVVNGTSKTFGQFPDDDDWHRIFLNRVGGSVTTCWIDGVQLGTSFTGAQFDADLHDRTIFLANYHKSSGYFGGDIARMSIWNSAETPGTAVAPDFADWNLEYPGFKGIKDNVTGQVLLVNAINTDTFFRHEQSRITGRKPVFAYKSCGNLPGPYPLNINNIGTVNGWQFFWGEGQTYVDDGADGYYCLLPFSRAANEPSVISGDAAFDLLRYTADGSLDDFDPNAIFPVRYTSYMAEFLANNPDKHVVTYLGGPTRDVTIKPQYTADPGRWLNRMSFELLWFLAATTGKLKHQRYRSHIHVDLSGGAQGSRADLEKNSLVLAFYESIAANHPFAVEPLPGASARHLFKYDNISTWSAFTGGNSVFLPEYTNNVWVLVDNDANAESRIDTLAAHPYVTHLIVPPGKLDYALLAVGA